jgi:hypothetical protein
VQSSVHVVLAGQLQTGLVDVSQTKPDRESPASDAVPASAAGGELARLQAAVAHASATTMRATARRFATFEVITRLE